METFMSKGPGRIERAIEAAFKADPDNAFPVEDLCDVGFPGVGRAEKKQRVSVIRAAKQVAKRAGNLDHMTGENLGGTLVFYDRFNVLSYAMARLKSDGLHRYRSHDDRWFTPSA